ncbi:thiol peroxidase [Stieleria sp. ICT_E10.1]|uniref:thiol peroxidase n=1 Tax=Stieleria sedimenti TaxID=2976331 RepID=UPI000BADFD31|nr:MULTISPECIES: thiol peroxidase [Pirellulaceae]MCS7466466.1 thiol peroxidase [Stieleria sedimenti]MDV6033624.1 thiol peroxidase [Phycisphaera sp. RhM]PAY19556.1 lipid hydroperoxide peroxidase [Rhodopirellula sp. SM50]
MSQTGVITFKGNPMTLAGEALAVGSPAPDFQLHYADGGIQTLTLADLKGKPSIISVVPSLDTPTCATQTKKFNEELASLGDKINAVTVSRDLPFAQARFCGAEDIKMRTASDYQTHAFGNDYGLTIEELKLLTRAVLVLNADGEIVHKEIVAEVTEEPDYATAMAALRMLL